MYQLKIEVNTTSYMFVIVKNILLSVFSPQFKTLLSKYSYFLARMNLQEMYNVQKKTILMKFF